MIPQHKGFVQGWFRSNHPTGAPFGRARIADIADPSVGV